MSDRLLPPVVKRTTYKPSEIQVTFWVDPATDLAGFLKAGIEELIRVWDTKQLTEESTT